MPEFSRPATYLDKLRFAERVLKAAQFRVEPKQAVREMCEAMTEVVAALLERELGTPPETSSSDKKPTP